MKRQLITITGLIIAATAATLVPHPPNFAPVAAIALFAGAKFADKRAAFAVPMIALLLRDLVVGMHVLMPFVYGSHALSVCLGLLLQNKEGAGRLAIASIAGSLQFFLITNFAVWLVLGTYPPTGAGLLACYVAGLPHFASTIASDLIYTAVLFGCCALAQRQFASQRAHA